MKRKKTKIEILWGIRTGRVLLPYTVRPTRKEAIKDFSKSRTFVGTQFEDPKKVWKEYRKMGYETQKIEGHWSI